MVFAAEMPPQPAHSESNAAAQARHLSEEPNFTTANYRSFLAPHATFILVMVFLTPPRPARGLPIFPGPKHSTSPAAIRPAPHLTFAYLAARVRRIGSMVFSRARGRSLIGQPSYPKARRISRSRYLR